MAGTHEIDSGIIRRFIIPNSWKILKHKTHKTKCQGFPGGAVFKNPPANAGDMGSSPGPGRSHMPQSN